MKERDEVDARGYWLKWIGANAAGLLAAFTVAQLYARVLFASDLFIGRQLEQSNYIWSRPLDSPIGALTFGLILGAILGLCQFFGLRQRFDIKPQLWIGASMISLALDGLLDSLYFRVLSDGSAAQGLSGGSGALGGFGLLCSAAILPVLPQWLVLRNRYRRAGWWLPASFIGLLLINRLDGTSGLVQWIVISLVAGGVYGLVTAFALHALAEPDEHEAETSETVLVDSDT